MWVGVTTAAPDTLTLPSCACGWECAVVMNSDCVDECGMRVSTDSQQRLWIHMSNMQLCLSKSSVSDQNGVSLLYVMFEIHHSGWEPSKCGSEVGQSGQEGYCVTVCGSEVGQSGQEGYCVTVCGSEVGQGGQEAYCVIVCGSEVGQSGQEGYCATVCGSEVGQSGQEGYCVTVCVSDCVAVK